MDEAILELAHELADAAGRVTTRYFRWAGGDRGSPGLGFDRKWPCTGHVDHVDVENRLCWQY